MTEKHQSRRSRGNNEQIPKRVEQAAQSMQASSGPRRGYIPPDTGTMQPIQGGWQQGGQVPPQAGYYYAGQTQQNAYYAGQNPQQGYYAGQSQMTGSQRGFIMQPAQPPQQPRKKHKPVFAVIAVFLLLAALGTGGYFALTSYLHNKTITEKVEPYDQLFCPGVYVDGINLEGMTPEQAWNSVQSQIQQRHDAWKVQLVYNGIQVAEINSDMLEFSVDATQVMYSAWAQGHTGDMEQRYQDMLRLEQEPYTDYTAQPSGNTQIIDDKLAEIKSAIDKPVVNAEMVRFDPSLAYPFEITDEEYGYNLNTEPIKNQLYQMVSTMTSGTVELIPDRIEPDIRKADVMKDYMLRSYAST